MIASTGTSKYRAVYDELLRRVGEMTVGDRLPSETELCDELSLIHI